MDSQLRLIVLSAVASAFAFAPATEAFEKVAQPFSDVDRDDDWRGGSTACTIQYYNSCTGWSYGWRNWDPGDQFGVVFTPCCSGTTNELALTEFFCYVGSPTGYDYTGVVEVHAADANGCPTGSPITSWPHLPISGWNTFLTPVAMPGGDFVVSFTSGQLAVTQNPMQIGSDHPAVGPTGPQACGTCYPMPRTTHSFYYGPVSNSFCPSPVALSDGTCDVEFLWTALINCSTATPVRNSSWTTIKALYR